MSSAVEIAARTPLEPGPIREIIEQAISGHVQRNGEQERTAGHKAVLRFRRSQVEQSRQDPESYYYNFICVAVKLMGTSMGIFSGCDDRGEYIEFSPA
jgi:hypothetical protein